MMKRSCLLLLALGGLAWAWCAGPAAAQPAERYRVTGVSADDVLNIRTGPSVSFPVAGAIPHDARGVEGLGDCVEGWCPIRFGSVRGWSSARFLAVDSEAAPRGDPMPARRVLDDGTLEIRFPDGSARRLLPDGTEEAVGPDGSTRAGPQLSARGDRRGGQGEQDLRLRIHTPTADLPPLPPQFQRWGSSLGNELLSILGNILTSAELEAYLQTEADKNYYERLDRRLRSIEFLTAPGS